MLQILNIKFNLYSYLGQEIILAVYYAMYIVVIRSSVAGKRKLSTCTRI